MLNDQLFETRNDQQFAVKNSTECWDVFYLHKGLDSEFFRAETQRMTDLKMWAERADNDFKHSVFGFGIRYSPLGLGDIAEGTLVVSDAHKWPLVTAEQLKEARQYFGGTTRGTRIVEFPS